MGIVQSNVNEIQSSKFKSVELQKANFKTP